VYAERHQDNVRPTCCRLLRLRGSVRSTILLLLLSTIISLVLLLFSPIHIHGTRLLLLL
jgi:hypothetical protein